MRRLFPVTDQTHSAAGTGADSGAGPGVDPGADRDWTLDQLADAYAYPRTAGAGSGAGTGTDTGSGTGTGTGSGAGGGARPWLRANMVSTLDGAAHQGGRSQSISSPADMRVFGTLRALADAVVVGAETVRLEGYRPARARAAFAARRAAAGQAPAPAIAVVSASLELDFTLPLFAAPLVPTLILTGAEAPQERILAAEKAGVEVVIAGDGPGADPERVVRALADRGLVRLLTEGGPRLLGQFVAAGLLDELCLTMSPMLTSGYAQRIAAGPAPAVPERFALASLLEQDGFLFSRYLRV
ncbi:pyrimidine reductase family protein [Streptomyces sp. NPDC059896]|uniref:pyrimidine reductase family protein n=1 Tax=Streptomyces sp. NPDC059896 TaxID=3346993 RepID=UPI003646E801